MRIKDANSILEERLKTFKTETDINILNNVARDINQILYQGIINYPTEVNAVRIRSLVDINKDRDKMPDRGTGRYKLENFLKAVLDDSPREPQEFEFVKHLPYIFTTGTHGSGERAAMGMSCPNIVFEASGIIGDAPAYVVIDSADSGFLMQERMFLYPEEIKSIRFDKVDEFTPIDKYLGNKVKLDKASSSAMHYIRFKGFYEYIGDVPKKYELAKGLLMPQYGSRLFNTRWGILNPRAFSGFAVNDEILYEFTDVRIPFTLRKSTDNRIFVAYAIMKGKGDRYEGDAIIERLSKIDITRKF